MTTHLKMLQLAASTELYGADLVRVIYDVSDQTHPKMMDILNAGVSAIKELDDAVFDTLTPRLTRPAPNQATIEILKERIGEVQPAPNQPHDITEMIDQIVAGLSGRGETLVYQNAIDGLDEAMYFGAVAGIFAMIGYALRRI